MANFTISDYTAAGSLSATNDYFLIEIASPNVYRKINRNVILGITGAPLGTTDTQTISNKTIGNTNTITVKDGSLTLQNSSDVTKQVVFSLSGITTATTRTITIPNRTDTLATLAGTEVLTNKTLTSPTITGGSIDNTTITVDSISGHTTPTLVTVGGVQLNNGVITTANSVTATAIADGAIQPKALVTGTGSGWSSQSYTPTFGSLTVGNGTLTSRYIQTAKLVYARISLVFGTTTAVTGDFTFTLPVTAVAYAGASSLSPIGMVRAYDVSAALVYEGSIVINSTTTASVRFYNAAATYATGTNPSSTIPFTWVNPDELSIYMTYEAA